MGEPSREDKIMNAHARIEQEHAVALPPNGAKLLEEYYKKKAAIPELVARITTAQDMLKENSSIRGAYTDNPFSEANVRADKVQRVLLRNAWAAIRELYKIDEIAPVSDRDELDRVLANPPELTPEAMVEIFGDYLLNPRLNQLRKLAEIFVRLDDAYKSHSKVKIGVKGLPKRIILQGMGINWFPSYRQIDRLHDILCSLQVFDGYGVPVRGVAEAILKGERTHYRGLEFKGPFKVGTLHIYFNEHALLQANRCLAEYYGDVLPDVEPDKDDLKADPKAKDLSKDLQYYPTPNEVASTALWNVGLKDGGQYLEPSCGCGRLIKALFDKAEGYSREIPKIHVYAYEVDADRVACARRQGLGIIERRNFLEVEPSPMFDGIFMNPPFYGRHYQKHVEHALKFLKPGGWLMAILPATARYDHGFIEAAAWTDLPVGSFSESGTNVPTGFARLRAPSQ